MDRTKKNAPAETAEEMEARIRAEVEAEMKAKMAEEDDENDDEENGEDGEKKSGDKADAKAKADDALRAEVSQIADACALAGVPEKAAEYIAAKKSLAQVMADLKKVVADKMDKSRTNANNGGSSRSSTSGLDASAIYAKWNSPKRAPRGNSARN